MLSPLCEETRYGVLTFDEQGTLLKVEQVENLDSMPEVEFFSGVLIPGFVNTHCHLELSYLKGVLSEGKGLATFVDEIMIKRYDFCDMDRISAASFHDSKMWSEGVMAVGDICNDELVFPVKAKSPVKYHSFIELFTLDNRPETVNEYMLTGQRIEDAAIELHLDNSTVPHATYSVCDPLWNKIIAKTCGEHKRLSIHFMESSTEIEVFEGEGNLMDRKATANFDHDFLYFKSPADRVVRTVDKDTPTILIHNTHIREQDIDLIMSHFSDVTFVLCPRSNWYIDRAQPPYDLFISKGCKLALGTDGLSSNTTLSIFDELKYLARTQPHIPFTTILEWATLGGAQGLGMEDVFGSFTVGKQCGALLIEGFDWERKTVTEHSKIRRII